MINDKYNNNREGEEEEGIKMWWAIGAVAKPNPSR